MRMRWLCCWLLLVSLAGAMQAGHDPAIQGMKLQRSGDLAGAVQAYQAALASDPDRVDVLTNLGAVLAQQAKYEQAITTYKKALAIAPAFAPAQLNLALAYYKDSFIEPARDLLLKYHRQHPGDLRVDLLLADCDLRLGDNAAVIAVAGPWERQQPENLALAYLLGTAYIRNGQSAEGDAFINRIMVQGDRPEVHMMLGDAYSHAHDFKKAATEFARAVAMDPNLPGAHLRLAETELMTGDSGHAFADLQAEYKIDPGNFETNFYLGLEYKNRGDLSTARIYLEKARNMRPDATNALLQLALIAYQQQQYPEARTMLETVVRNTPEDVQAHVVLGQVYYRLHLRNLGLQQRELVQKLNAERQRQSIQQRETVSQHLKPIAKPTNQNP